MSKITTTTLPLALLLAAPLSAEEVPRQDLLTFAAGVLPVAIGTGAAGFKTDMSHAIAAIDGNPTGLVMTPKPGTESETVEITYALPAPTRFDGFSIPNVLETRSPSQTFFRKVEILGAADEPEGPYQLLAQAVLSPHENKGELTSLTLEAAQPEVSWVRLRLSGGLAVEREMTYFEFSEIIGTGVQQDQQLSDGFTGAWKGRGVKIELAQEGAAVKGCYDTDGRLEGTVSGTVLRALGQTAAGIPSQFILIAGADGALRGLRSSNGAPFKPYDGSPSGAPANCLAPEPPGIGCGSVVHGIGFEFDSDAIRPGAETILAALHAGLAGTQGAIEIVGHSSSEGAADYNRDLSQRRAAAVASALAGLGLDNGRLSSSGMGEDAPIASNDDEAGRSLNRRVEVRCTG